MQLASAPQIVEYHSLSQRPIATGYLSSAQIGQDTLQKQPAHDNDIGASLFNSRNATALPQTHGRELIIQPSDLIQRDRLAERLEVGGLIASKFLINLHYCVDHV